MIEPTTYAGKRLISQLKRDVDLDRIETYAEMVRMVELEVEARSKTEEAEEGRGE